MNAKEARTYWGVVILLAILLGVLLQCAEAHAEGYPRIGAYVGVRSGGQPLTRADGSIDSAVCRDFARFPEVALDHNALHIGAAIIPTLLHFNPEIRIDGYQHCASWWLAPDFPVQSSDKTFNAYWHLGLQATHGFIAGAPREYQVNLAQRATVDTMGSLMIWSLERLRISGMFWDYCSPAASWVPVGNTFTDQERIRNVAQMSARIRDAMPYGFKVYGNGTGAESCGLDGTLVEGFPGSVGPFSKAIAQKDGDWLKSEGSRTDYRAQRFVLGTACLTGARLTYGQQVVDAGGQGWPGQWWFDEWSVTPEGKPDPTGQHVGWLGEALGPFTKLASGLYVRFFEHGADLVNPTGNPITQDMIWPRYHRIGQLDPVLKVVVPATDAVLLWGD
jgi:hypothetical protein